MAVRFVRPTEIIDQLRTFRDGLGLTDSDFKILGAGDYDRAIDSGTFVQSSSEALYVMVSNSSSAVITEAGVGENEVTHAIDIVLYKRLEDNRAQTSDQRGVWFKEFIIRALFGWQPYEGSEPIQFGGDIFNNIRNAADYSRTYQVTQSYRLDQSDVECCGTVDDLDDFTNLYNLICADAPDFGDIAQTELDIEIEQD